VIRVGERKLIGRHFRNIFIVQNRNWWKDCPHSYDKDLDLILTFDFALVHEITAQGGTAAYLDHLGDPDEMERYNVETYQFFDTWYLNQEQKDIFSYKGLDFGNTLRLDIWNDVTYYVRIFLNLMIVRKLMYEQIVAGVEDVNVLSVLDRLDLRYDRWSKGNTTSLREFYFPTFRWMKENIRPQRFRQRLGAFLFRILDFTFTWGDRLRLLRSAKADVFVDRYHPTIDIVERLKMDKRVNVVLPTYWKGKGLFHERRLPVTKPSKRHAKMATEMISSLESKRSSSWEIEGFRISDILYGIISEKIVAALPHCFHIIEAITGFFETRNLRLFVITANIGLVNGLMLEYCAKNKIPVYFIINGLMLHKFYAEEIDKMTWINSYGESIKKYYFRDADNVICCGDPRMDRYVSGFTPKLLNYDEPTIVIGAGGFSNIDMNSYVAAEFDFFYDIMQALKILSISGKKMKIVLKVRANGYIDQYEAFLKEYFPDMPVEVFDTIPFSQLIVRADFYMSIYSGTLFEASLLGIPALYYKKDTSLLNPPYDGKSELVTAFTIPDLVEKLELFYQQDPLFDAFKEKQVMEKYIGPLDGKNLQRNMDFINSRLFETMR
jgi:hypothetical protein